MAVPAAGLRCREEAIAVGEARLGTCRDPAATARVVWLRTRMSPAETSTDPKLQIQSRPKGSGAALPSVAQGNRPGTGAGGNRGFPNVADKTGGGQLAGRAQGARGGQFGAVAGGAVAGAGLANIGRGDLRGRGDFSPERNQAIANRQQYWDKWSGDNQGKLADFRTNRGKDWSNINNFRKNENIAGRFNTRNGITTGTT